MALRITKRDVALRITERGVALRITERSVALRVGEPSSVRPCGSYLPITGLTLVQPQIILLCSVWPPL